MALNHTGAAVSLKAISRAFGSVAAVRRISLEVERGEAVLIRGPNGAGKSTLLRIIATALSPTGRGQILGFDLLSEREEIRRRTELISHRTHLYEDLTAVENLQFAAVIYMVDPKKVARALNGCTAGGLACCRARRDCRQPGAAYPGPS